MTHLTGTVHPILNQAYMAYYQSEQGLRRNHTTTTCPLPALLFTVTYLPLSVLMVGE